MKLSQEPTNTNIKWTADILKSSMKVKDFQKKDRTWQVLEIQKCILKKIKTRDESIQLRGLTFTS